jgi:hypothetical protein
MYTGGFCSLRRQDGFWDGSGLYSADYVRDAATEAGHEGLAADRPAGRGGMQEAGSEFWKGWPSHNRPHSRHQNCRARRGAPAALYSALAARSSTSSGISKLRISSAITSFAIAHTPLSLASNSTRQNRLHSRPQYCDQWRTEIQMIPIAPKCGRLR